MDTDATTGPDASAGHDASAGPCGLLNLDKPVGMTSRDAVNRIVHALRRHFPKPARLPKVGHAGTLDPMASGVLIVGIGAAVRLVPYLHHLDKSYQVTFRLGQSSPSGDLETELVEESEPVRPTADQINAAAASLVGDITQIPPAHSAIKVGGRKAYHSAHRGQEVVIPPRVVRVESFEIVRYDYPEVEATIRCGTGTYIRTLGIDLAKSCGTTAVMTALVRTRIGDFRLEDAVPPDRITQHPEELTRYLQPLALAVALLPRWTLNDTDMTRLCHGLKIEPVAGTSLIDDTLTTAEALPQHRGVAPQPEGPEIAVFDESGELRAIARLRKGLLHAHRVFPKPIATP